MLRSFAIAFGCSRRTSFPGPTLLGRALVVVFAGISLDAARALAQPAMPALTRANLDTTCAPCRDFYRFANGGWLDRTQVPPAYSSWGSFDELQERNSETLHAILEKAAANANARPNSDEWMLGTYWCACMDSGAADAAGSKPIEPILRDIE